MTMRRTGAARCGFTLIELMVVIAIIAIVLVIAAPSFRDLIEMQRLRGTHSQFTTDVQFARSEAVSRQEVIGISFNLNPAAEGMSCYIVHTCGTTTATSCSCDCTAAEGSRCPNSPSTPGGLPPRELRTLQLPASSNVLLVPTPTSPATSTSHKVTFDPATGGITVFFIIGVTGPPPGPPNEFWVTTSLTSPGGPRSLRLEIGATGRPKTCAPAGSTVSGATPC